MYCTIFTRRCQVIAGKFAGDYIWRMVIDQQIPSLFTFNEALVISERAVEKHVTSIFAKLDLPPAAETHRRVLAVLAFLHT